MKNWRTTITGIITAVVANLPVLLYLIRGGQISDEQIIAGIVGGLTALGLYQAKDK